MLGTIISIVALAGSVYYVLFLSEWGIDYYDIPDGKYVHTSLWDIIKKKKRREKQERKLAFLATCVLVTCGEEVLLIRRRKSPHIGKLALPGGHVENYERSIQAAQRELREETGLDIALDRFKLFCLLDSPERDKRSWCRSSASCYKVEITPLEKKNVIAASDALSCEWVNRKSIEMDKVAFDHSVAINKLNGERVYE